MYDEVVGLAKFQIGNFEVVINHCFSNNCFTLWEKELEAVMEVGTTVIMGIKLLNFKKILEPLSAKQRR